jgi:Uma2 family endonuclease
MQLAEPKVRQWTRAEYHQMAELGWFQGQRAELVEGEIVVLSPQKFAHAAATDRAAEALRTLLADAFWVRMQLPVVLTDLSEPEPDVSVVPGRREDYSDHPRGASLVIEVSDTTVLFDRGKKLGMYAGSGIPEYWIVDLPARAIEVRKRPVDGAGDDDLARYLDLTVYRPGDAIELDIRPGARVAVDQLLG